MMQRVGQAHKDNPPDESRAVTGRNPSGGSGKPQKGGDLMVQYRLRVTIYDKEDDMTFTLYDVVAVEFYRTRWWLSRDNGTIRFTGSYSKRSYSIKGIEIGMLR